MNEGKVVQSGNIRGNETANTDGLLDGPHTVSGNRGLDGVAVDTGRLLAEPLEEVGGVGDLALGVGDGLAVLPGDEGGEVLGVLHHEVVPAAQQLRALTAGLGAEGLESRGGRGDGGVRIGLGELGTCSDLLAGRRVCSGFSFRGRLRGSCSWWDGRDKRTSDCESLA